MKRILTVLMVLMVLSGIYAGGKNEATKSGDRIKIGYTIRELSNPFWADVIREFDILCKAKGWQLTAVDCGSDSGTQITQIENFITSGMKIIIVQPVDPNALTDITAVARESGVFMVGHGVSFPAADTNWIDDNFECGRHVGLSAAKWAKEIYGNVEVEAGEFNYPQIKEGQDRNDGIAAGLRESNSKIKIVATQTALEQTPGMAAAETMLQAHPNIKMFLTISDAGALGACEVLESMGVDSDKYAVFGIDATAEALNKISSHTPFFMSVNKGNGLQVAEGIMGVCNDLFSGNFKKTYIAPTITVDRSNVKDFM
jgi:ribose transport system substrate-binding protein